jgi:hypothetical protein
MGTLALWAAQSGATHVTDRLAVGLYDKAGVGQPRRVLVSGTPLEVQERGERYCRVLLSDGDSGWLECQYLTDNKPARVLLLEAQARTGQFRQELDNAQATLKARDLRIAELETRLRAAANLFGSQGPAASAAHPPAPAQPPAAAAAPPGPGLMLPWVQIPLRLDPLGQGIAAGLGLLIGLVSGLLLRGRRRAPPPRPQP